MKNSTIKNVIEHGIEGIDDLIGTGSTIYGADLHNELYNTDYFIIGYANAEKFLEQYGTFAAIRDIKEYEQDSFGEVTTDLSDSEKVANMFAYIKGEEALNECGTLQKHWDDVLTDKQLKAIKAELKAQL